jgi:hypothetical protein
VTQVHDLAPCTFNPSPIDFRSLTAAGRGTHRPRQRC